jgi:hypothetical protein
LNSIFKPALLIHFYTAANKPQAILVVTQRGAEAWQGFDAEKPGRKLMRERN